MLKDLEGENIEKSYVDLTKSLVTRIHKFNKLLQISVPRQRSVNQALRSITK